MARHKEHAPSEYPLDDGLFDEDLDYEAIMRDPAGEEMLIRRLIAIGGPAVRWHRHRDPHTELVKLHNGFRLGRHAIRPDIPSPQFAAEG